MYLQKLVIQGFKSFANKTTLEFTPGVTAVVGPNGSGKSNTADAVRWVLGEQSLKTLRGKKSEDVIFAGSDKKTRLGFCQVDMHLNNDDHQAPVDFSEIIITRKIYRDGEGEYYINKNKVRLQDILMLLAKSNFGQRSYSIISQGMVDLFLAATPTQRKEFFDEAAGVRQFQLKKEQAEHKLSLTRENLHQAELLIQEIEPRLRSLTRQVHRLEKREEVVKQLKELQHGYYAGLWHDLKSKHEEQEQRYRQSSAQQKNMSSELESIQKKMHQLALGSSRPELFQDLQKEYNQLIAEKNKLLRDQAVLKGKIDIDREQKGELDLVWLERRQELLEQTLHNFKSADEAGQGNIKKYTQSLEQAEQAQQAIEGKIAALNQKLQEAKNHLAAKKNITLPEISQEIDRFYEWQKQLLENIEKAATVEDIHNIKAEARRLSEQMSRLVQKLKDTKGGNPHDIIALQDEVAQLLARKDGSVSAVNEIKIKLQVEKEKTAINLKQISEMTSELAKISQELARAGSQKTPQELAAGLAQEQKVVASSIDALDNQIKAINAKLTGFNQAEQQKKEEVFALQNTFADKQNQLNAIDGQVNDIKIELAKIETRQEDLTKEMIDELSEEERQNIHQAKNPPPAQPDLFSEIQKFKKQIELIGGIDPQVAEEYRQTKERHDFLTHQSDDLLKAMADLEQAIASLEETIKEQFDKSFEEINLQFSQYFKILFNGGHASLSLVKEEITEEAELENDEDGEEGETEQDKEPAEQPKKSPFYKKAEKVITGIDIHATPPGKKLRGISMLSGGERALTSIALICAIIHNNPSPFVILDEVDAALDESNSIRFASIVERLSKKTQFIVITHNRATMNKAHILYGVTMGDDGVSRLLSINMAEAEKVVKEK